MKIGEIFVTGGCQRGFPPPAARGFAPGPHQPFEKGWTLNFIWGISVRYAPESVFLLEDLGGQVLQGFFVL